MHIKRSCHEIYFLFSLMFDASFGERDLLHFTITPKPSIDESQRVYSTTRPCIDVHFFSCWIVYAHIV